VKKVRTYRRKARKEYLKVAKKRKISKKKIYKANKKQLQYLRRNVQHIEELKAATPLTELKGSEYKKLLVVSEVYLQQKEMLEKKCHSIPDRIVSISQPHVRPIVRGKDKGEVEFGAKMSVSMVDGYAFLEKLSWDAYNEANELISHIEKYKERFGYYPKSVHADAIYRNRENRQYCNERNIRLSGPKLGRPPKDIEKYRAILQEAKQDEIDRIPIEGSFGTAKRRYGIDRIKTKLSTTSETSVGITILVMNLEKIRRDLLLSFFRLLYRLLFGTCLCRKLPLYA
jgi:hypothetical protein